MHWLETPRLESAGRPPGFARALSRSQRAHSSRNPDHGPGVLAWLMLALLRVYRLGISPWIPPSCRFYPSCSRYAAEAIRMHGALNGSYLAALRLAKCHPWHPGGFDPVPGSAPAELP